MYTLYKITAVYSILQRIRQNIKHNNYSLFDEHVRPLQQLCHIVCLIFSLAMYSFTCALQIFLKLRRNTRYTSSILIEHIDTVYVFICGQVDNMLYCRINKLMPC